MLTRQYPGRGARRTKHPHGGVACRGPGGAGVRLGPPDVVEQGAARLPCGKRSTGVSQRHTPGGGGMGGVDSPAPLLLLSWTLSVSFVVRTGFPVPG